jgi:hypothetical protein
LALANEFVRVKAQVTLGQFTMTCWAARSSRIYIGVAMKQRSDDAALAALMRSTQAGDAHAYGKLLKDITPRL